ncbi:hypothetical protein [Streptomyces sp. NBC_00690]|uniref:hypothetical protein n=1 Tax=Streptomyces sp. NBC_00690 TaxID=2975808 RepID=UPI002E2DB7AA|nr:hypothetical protein [Streptomyces sp. NBC_00690]
MNTKDTEKTDGTTATGQTVEEAVPAASAEESNGSNRETGADAQDGREAHSDDDVSAAATPTAETDAADAADDEIEDAEAGAANSARSSGLLSAAAGIVAAGLGVVGLTGSWTGRVAAERQTLLGQIETSEGGSTAERISALYGDAWHATALVNGMFALVALIVGLTVLTRPGKPGWVRAFGLGGAVLGGLGLLISIAMYFDLILSLPAAGS